MNLPALKRSLPVIALLVIAGVLIALPRLDALFFAGARYKHCGELLTSDPGQALNLAQAWRISRPDSPLAKHCEALALYAAKDYGHAAEAFGKLATEVTVSNPALAVQLLLQATQAHIAAGHPALAQQTAASVLLLQPDNAEAKGLLADIVKDTAAKPSLLPQQAQPIKNAK